MKIKNFNWQLANIENYCATQPVTRIVFSKGWDTKAFEKIFLKLKVNKNHKGDKYSPWATTYEN